MYGRKNIGIIHRISKAVVLFQARDDETPRFIELRTARPRSGVANGIDSVIDGPR